MKIFIKFSVIASLFFSAFLMAAAQNSGATQQTITFPIAELGNCGSQVECKAYCNKQENIDACTAFAEAHNLINAQEKQKNQKFAQALKNGGPGGCTDADSCKAYCQDQSHA